MPAAEAEITYEDLLQSEQIIIKSAALSDEQIACLATISDQPPFPILFFENSKTAQRSQQLARTRDRPSAQEWLRERGILEKLPRYDPDQESIHDFARKLERFCGIEPGGYFEVGPSGFLVAKPSGDAPTISADQFMCLMNASLGAGLSFGFVGNENAAEDEEP